MVYNVSLSNLCLWPKLKLIQKISYETVTIHLSVRQAVIGSAITSLIMGGFIVAGRFGVREVMSAADLTFYRYLSGLFFLPLFFSKSLRTLGGLGWGPGMLITVLAGWVFNMLLMTGFQFAPAAHGAVFGPGTMSMFAALFAWLFLGEKLTLWRIAGLVVLMMGLVMLGGGGFFESNPDAWKGDLLFLSAAIFWGAFTVSIRYFNVEPLYAVAVVAVLSMVTFSPLYFLFFDPAMFHAPLGDNLFHLFYQGVLVGGTAVVLFTISIPVLGPARTALFMAMVPVFGTLLGIPILGEVPGLVESTGIILVILGMLAAMGLRLSLYNWRI